MNKMNILIFLSKRFCLLQRLSFNILLLAINPHINYKYNPSFLWSILIIITTQRFKLMSFPESYLALRKIDQNQDPQFIKFPFEKPSKNEVIVKVEYAPIHPSDNDMMKGLYTIDPSKPGLLGSEGSGVIVAIGEDLKIPHKVGDKVYIVSWGTYTQFITLQSENAILIKNGLSLEEASCHFINPGTAYEMAIRAIEGGHKAAINTAASSDLGRMLIRLFKHKGIKLINIVRNDKYIEELKKEGADYVLNYQNPNFENELSELIEKEEVSVAFDGIGGDFVETLLKLLPNNSKSTVFGYGNVSGSSHTKFNFIIPIVGEKTFRGLGFSTYFRELTKNGKALEYLEEVHALLPTVLKPKIIKIFKIEDVKEARDFFEANKTTGKILLKF